MFQEERTGSTKAVGRTMARTWEQQDEDHVAEASQTKVKTDRR